MLLRKIFSVVWAFLWKMFNPDTSKKSKEICFSLKCDNENYPSLVQVVLNDNMLLARSI